MSAVVTAEDTVPPKPSIAIIQRQTLHTEVMGALAALAHAAGYDVYLYYNLTDRWEMVTYFLKHRMPWIKGVGEWTVPFRRPDATYTFLVLTTSDEWRAVPRPYRRVVSEWASHNRLVVVHHDMSYLPQYEGVYRRHIGLTSAYPQWIFPLYGSPTAPMPAATTTATRMPPLTVVGGIVSKDQDNIRCYMEAGGHVHHYVRYPEPALVEAYPEAFHSHTDLAGVTIMEMLHEAVGNGKGILWLPVCLNSGYADKKFTGALTLAVECNALLLMPRVLQQTYGFPDAAVAVYERLCTEETTLRRLTEMLRDPAPCLAALHAWKCEMWERNTAIWATLTADA